MKKTVAIILFLLVVSCFLGAYSEEIPSGERKVGVDLAPGWYALVLEKSGFSATHVFLPEGCVIKLPENALLFQLAGEIPAPSISFGPDGLIETKQPSDSSKLLLYEDDRLSISFSDLRVEKLSSSAYLKTELLFVNKTNEMLDVTCDSIIVNGCAVDISKYVEVPAKSKYLNEWTNGAEMYLKYGISELETIAIVFNYRGLVSNEKVKTTQTEPISVK